MILRWFCKPIPEQLVLVLSFCPLLVGEVVLSTIYQLRDVWAHGTLFHLGLCWWLWCLTTNQEHHTFHAHLLDFGAKIQKQNCRFHRTSFWTLGRQLQMMPETNNKQTQTQTLWATCQNICKHIVPILDWVAIIHCRQRTHQRPPRNDTASKVGLYLQTNISDNLWLSPWKTIHRATKETAFQEH